MSILESKMLRNGELLTLETCTIAGSPMWVLVWQTPAKPGHKANIMDMKHATCESVARAAFDKTVTRYGRDSRLADATLGQSREREPS